MSTQTFFLQKKTHICANIEKLPKHVIYAKIRFQNRYSEWAPEYISEFQNIVRAVCNEHFIIIRTLHISPHYKAKRNGPL